MVGTLVGTAVVGLGVMGVLEGTFVGFCVGVIGVLVRVGVIEGVKEGVTVSMLSGVPGYNTDIGTVTLVEDPGVFQDNCATALPVF